MIKTIFKGFVYFLGLITLIGLIGAACSDEDVEYQEDPIPADTLPYEEVKTDFEFVEEPVFVHDEFISHIDGVVRNNTDKDYSYLQIEFTLYDEQGNVVGSAFDNINNVPAGGTWRFEASIFDDVNAARWEFTEITGW